MRLERLDFAPSEVVDILSEAEAFAMLVSMSRRLPANRCLSSSDPLDLIESFIG